MSDFKETIDRWRDGDHVEDLELMFLTDAFRKVHESTLVFGEKYELVCIDAFRNLQNAKSFLKARGYGKGEENE